MTSYSLSDTDLESLRGQTIVIIGAATGIGRAAVDIAIEYGANIVIGDWNKEVGNTLVESLGERAVFRECDVSNWDHVFDLFEAACTRFGAIHAVLSNAGINTHEGLLNFDTDSRTGRLLPPNLKSIDVNLVGQVYVTRCALYFSSKFPETPCRIVMTASAGSFFPAPPIHLYCAAKSGTLGLMRALRHEVQQKNVTVNIVAPWLTITPMLLGDWLGKWTLPKNTPEGVARALFLPVVKLQTNGKSFFVAGDKIVEFEDSLYKAEPDWMGQPLCDQVRKGQEILLG